MPTIRLAGGARSPDPYEALILAVLHRAHLDAASHNPFLAIPAKKFLSEIQAEVYQQQRGVYVTRTNDRVSAT